VLDLSSHLFGSRASRRRSKRHQPAQS
jgi:hypothetical protein